MRRKLEARLCVRLPQALMDKLKALAERLDLSVGDVVRLTLEKGLYGSET